MTISIKTPEIYLWIIRALSLWMPKQSRLEWRREWEAEIINRWFVLTEWEKLNAHTKLDLFKKVRGACFDVLWFQQRRSRLVLVALNTLVALLTGFGALQELIMRAMFEWKLQPFLISLIGIMVSILFLTSAVALLRDWSTVRSLIILTGTLSILLHVYGTLPPHRTMGFIALIVGAGYGLVMLVVFEWNKKLNNVP